ncbi:MAG TPA: hypothetical protein VGS09_11495 [Actinomycetota bacterium]|jgi:cytochrome c biogenesis protein CcdA|nr:hypothetical protein [Actinomycetota bacterium]
MQTVVKLPPAPLETSVPRSRGRTLAMALGLGVLVTYAWSFTLVDSVIGDNIANSLLGFDAKETAITGGLMGAMFAFVSGLAGTFTACNIAAFSAIAPLMEQERSFASKAAAVARPIGWLALGMVAVAGTYGAIGAAVGPGIPQLSEGAVGTYPIRLLQSTVVFGAIGLILLYMGLAALRIVPDPLARLYARHPRAQLVIMGALIGGFLIGRPFPLFFKMFSYAASTGNAAYGGLVFILQAAGNILVMLALFLLLAYGTRGGFQRWLEAVPGRVQRFTAAALIVAGSFTFLYWVVRVPAIFGYGWWPVAPWNA